MSGFDRITNQPLARSILEASLARNHYPSFIFAGPQGVGKRTLALLFAQAVNCRSEADRPCGECPECRHIANLSHPDVKLIMPLKPEGTSEDETKAAQAQQRLTDETLKTASEFGLDRRRPEVEARWQISIHIVHWLRREMSFAPFQARRRFAIILDADQMNQVSANAFLKTLEEPQKDTTFILVTERSHRLPDTIRSRCQTVPFAFLTRDAITDYLTAAAGAERVDAEVAAEVSGGSLRRALDYLERPEEFLSPVAVDYFKLAQPTVDDCRVLAEQAERASLEGIIDSLVFLYRQALRVTLGLPAAFVRQDPALTARARAMSLDFIRHRLETLLRVRREAEFNVNRRLFLFSLFADLTGSKSRVA